MISAETIAAERTKWVRMQSKMANMVQEMEKELETMRKKGIHESVIEAKSSRIDLVISALNHADDLIQVLSRQVMFDNFEIHLLGKQLTGQMLESPEQREVFFSDSHTMEAAKAFAKEISSK